MMGTVHAGPALQFPFTWQSNIRASRTHHLGGMYVLRCCLHRLMTVTIIIVINYSVDN